MSSGALELKELGNVKFRARLFREAADCYAEAEVAAPNDPVFPSNLSASLFELGDYQACLQAIIRAQSKLEESSPLVQRLSTRLAKTLSYGLRSGSIGVDDVHRDDAAINEMAKETGSPDASADLLAAWKEWRRIYGDFEKMEIGAPEARTRSSDLPVLKHSLDSALEYFSKGHDNPMSILDNWGSGSQEKDPLDLNKLSSDGLSGLAILFGGVGDARHVFGSLIGLKRSHTNLEASKQPHLHVHITLLDIHATILARDLCILVLLDDLIENQGRDEDTKLEIMATIVYIYVGDVVPSYCAERFQRVVQRMIKALQQSPQNSSSLPSWLHIDTNAVPGILDSLCYWDTGLGRKTTSDVLKLLSLAAEPHQHVDREFWAERQWYNQTRVLVPPLKLRKKHGKFNEAWAAFQNPSTKSAGSKLLKEVRAHISEHWKPNPSLFDRVNNERYDPEVKIQGYPFLEDIMFSHGIHKLHGACKGLKIPHNGNKLPNMDCPSFSVVQTFFDGVVDALKTLKGQIKLEILHGDLLHELVKMKIGRDLSRPSGFPRYYTRMWMSNIPDYTHGLLNMSLYAAPMLNDAENATVAFNCLRNGRAWKDEQHLCYTYTHLLPHELPKFLGCRVEYRRISLDEDHPFLAYGIDINLGPYGSTPARFRYTTTSHNAYCPTKPRTPR
ncbi:hypothetical protein EIP91_002655 [Steccherinum ochraceum]|uniref:DUF4470 domain-containing protein n=1 Tax=Steccherinum ochraceum TaxID=92696 RepID=A0A4R0S2I9_9APHY|nr:hypothetical protein EIP91_002655 [Steccherinum ochraceum]